MTEPHLILHKVRGEPAFDIAIRVQIGAEDETKPGWIEEAWIIPTSGHRAYPYQQWQLNELFWAPTESDPKISIIDASDSCVINLMTANWPDHYSTNASPKPSPFSPTSLLTRLGLLPKINRRF